MNAPRPDNLDLAITSGAIVALRKRAAAIRKRAASGVTVIDLHSLSSRRAKPPYVRDGRFPAPVAISKRRVAWVEGEIDRWIADRIAAQPRVRLP